MKWVDSSAGGKNASFGADQYAKDRKKRREERDVILATSVSLLLSVGAIVHCQLRLRNAKLFSRGFNGRRTEDNGIGQEWKQCVALQNVVV